MIPEQLKKEDFRFCLVEPKGKRPLGKSWQKEGYKIEDPKLLKHIEKNGNYGIIGGFGNLLILDFDDEEFFKKIYPKLPKTFSVKTGSGGYHFYYTTNIDEPKSYKIFDKEKNTLADIQCTGKMVVAPGSIHPNGEKYQVSSYLDIVEIDYEKLKDILEPYNEIKKKEPKKQTTEKIYKNNDVIDIIKNKIFISDLLIEWGIETTHSPTMCPLGHESKGGQCFSFSNDLWKCFHCDEGGDIFTLIQKREKIDFIPSVRLLADKLKIKYEIDHQLIEPQIQLLELRSEYYNLVRQKQQLEAFDLLANYIIKSNKIFTIRDDDKQEMWVYKEGIYVPHAKSYIKEHMLTILHVNYRNAEFSHVRDKIEAKTYIDKDDFFINDNTHLIALKNGVYDLKNDKLLPFSEDYRLFSKLNFSYSKNEECPNIMNFLKDITYSETDLKVIQEIIGYCLIKAMPIEKAVMLLGSGRNGKSKLIELIKHFLGSENCVSISLQEMEENQFCTAELFGKMANMCADLSKKAVENTGIFKSLTGNDKINAQRKFMSSIGFVNYSKQIFSCNELPKTGDITDAFFDRWVILDFPYKFIPKEEYDLLEQKEKKMVKIMKPDIIKSIISDKELSGLFNWALIGLKRILYNHKFSTSNTAISVREKWNRKSSSSYSFIMDYCTSDGLSTLYADDLQEAYYDYCKQKNLIPDAIKEFNKEINTIIGAVYTTVRKDKNTTVKAYKGVGVK